MISHPLLVVPASSTGLRSIHYYCHVERSETSQEGQTLRFLAGVWNDNFYSFPRSPGYCPNPQKRRNRDKGLLGGLPSHGGRGWGRGCKYLKIRHPPLNPSHRREGDLLPDQLSRSLNIFSGNTPSRVVTRIIGAPSWPTVPPHAR